MINFPDSPTLNQVFQGPNGVSYTWNGTLWLVQNTFAGGTGDFCASSGSWSMVAATPAVVTSYTVMTGNAGGWLNVSNGRYTPPAGRIQLNGFLSLSGLSSAIIGTATLRKNGVTIPGAVFSSTSLAATNPIECSVSAIVDANGADYFELVATTNATPGTSNALFSAFPLTGMQGPQGPSGNMLINGAGAPTGLSAAKGTLYINTTATTTTTRLYINTDGGTTWANFTASA